MKRLILSVMMLSAMPMFAADPKVGDPRASVVDELGRPKGSFASGNNELLTYERGKINLVDGKVTFVKLKTEAEAAQDRAAAEAAAKVEAERQKAIHDEGLLARSNALADPEFAKKSPADKLAFWQSFAKKYPSVQIRRELADAGTAQQADDAKRAADAAAKAAQAEAAKPKIPVPLAPGARLPYP